MKINTNYKINAIRRKINIDIASIERTVKIICMYEGMFRKTLSRRKYYYGKLRKYRKQLSQQTINFKNNYQKGVNHDK